MGQVRHRIAAEGLGTDSFRLIHQARDNGPPPTLAESLLVLGLLMVLTERPITAIAHSAGN